jgi:hypothetical protein
VSDAAASSERSPATETLAGGERVSLSFVVEWSNTRLNGVPRAWTLFDSLRGQWAEIRDGRFAEDLPQDAASFLRGLEPAVEVIVASGWSLAETVEDEIRARLGPAFQVVVETAPGLEYYPLKNAAARRARGRILLFVDSDVAPDDGWLAQLIGSFVHPDVHVVCARTYVPPRGVFSSAFALGWTYPLREEEPRLHRPEKFFANTLAIERDLFRQVEFPPLGRRTRGAASAIGSELAKRGVAVWENPAAAVGHPPPADLRHLVVRGLAHGRDVYWKEGEEQRIAHLARTVGLASVRFRHGVRKTLRHGRRIGLHAWQVPACLAIIGAYYACFAFGGVLTHFAPGVMGRRFRV